MQFHYLCRMIKVVILGGGNVAIQLAKAFLKAKNILLVQQYSRHNRTSFFIDNHIPTTQNLANLIDADLYIIAISDDAIANFSKKLILKNKLVVHTSGSVAMLDLQCNANKGVFYPLQSLSKQKKINFKKVPICIEAENKADFKLLKTVAKTISKKIYAIDSEQRKSLHVAAVFVNNFVNHLYKIGNDICDAKKVDFEILKPLIKETAKKITLLSPKEAQTGPAKRQDKKTIQNHLDLLTEKQQKIYTLLTNSIMDTEMSNGKK